MEIFYSGSWGSITDPNWTSEDAAVACRMMGYFKPGTFSVYTYITILNYSPH